MPIEITVSHRAHPMVGIFFVFAMAFTVAANPIHAQESDGPNWTDDTADVPPLAEILESEPLPAVVADRTPTPPILLTPVPSEGGSGNTSAGDSSPTTGIGRVETMDVVPRSNGEIAPDIRRLSLDQALALAVKQNLGVEVARYEPLIAEQDMEGAWGAYDPVFTGDIGYQLTEAPNTFSLNQANKSQDRGITGGLGLQGLVPYIGATLGIVMDTGRAQTNSTLQSLSPQYDSSIFLTAKIPLLRGLIWNEPWTQVKLNKIGYGSSVDGFRQAVMDVTESTINAYWSLVANTEQFEVARKSLETAQALLAQTTTQYEVGVVSKVEVVEAEAGVADREFNLITAQNDFENSEDVLIDAVLGRELKAVTNFRLRPADDPEDYRRPRGRRRTRHRHCHREPCRSFLPRIEQSNSGRSNSSSPRIRGSRVSMWMGNTDLPIVQETETSGPVALFRTSLSRQLVEQANRKRVVFSRASIRCSAMTVLRTTPFRERSRCRFRTEQLVETCRKVSLTSDGQDPKNAR